MFLFFAEICDDWTKLQIVNLKKGILKFWICGWIRPLSAMLQVNEQACFMAILGFKLLRNI